MPSVDGVIAFLGLGGMGAPMATRLLENDHPLTVWNRHPERAEPFRRRGARIAATPEDAVREADVVITMLADAPAVRSVAHAIRGVLRPTATLVDMSTCGPAFAHELAGMVPRLVDAPVMGSVDRAAEGTLTVLAGGDLADVRSVLETFGHVVACGPVGSGAALKIALIAPTVAGLLLAGDALRLGHHLGLPEQLMRDALANSPLAPLLARADSSSAVFPVRLAAKDLALAATAQLPMLDAALDILTEALRSSAADSGLDVGRFALRPREQHA